MQHRDLIVVGASAGGIEAVSSLLKGLPANLPAAVCVVVHLRPFLESRLPEVLGRHSPLPVRAAADGLKIENGNVYVAVPDAHLIVRESGGQIFCRIVHGPRENRARPSVDPLFRSAALARDKRVIGVVLSGALDDGTAGLWAIKDRGGLALAQDPSDAGVSSMPQSAITEVGADHVASAIALGELIGALTRQPLPVSSAPSGTSVNEELKTEQAILVMDDVAHTRSERYGSPSRYSCPDCGGVLWDVRERQGGPIRFRCETGHAYSQATLAEAQLEQIEYALFAALRALEDRVSLARLRAGSARDRGMAGIAEDFDVQESAALQHAAEIRSILKLNGRTGIRAGAKGEILRPAIP